MIDQAIVQGSQKVVIDAFKGFREELLGYYGAIEHKSKHDLSPVTELDVKIESTLKEKLMNAYPMLGFKGEETPEVVGESDAVWYVDPIDSTASFIHGLPYCSNMAALVVDGNIVASIIYKFIQDDLYSAVKDKGSFKNGHKITINDRPLQDSFVYADSQSYKNLYSYYEPHKSKFYAPVGATGHFLASVAEGSIQGVCYYGANIQPHDVAPGMLLVFEAGGDAVSFEKAPMSYSSKRFMMGTPSICKLTREFQEEIVNNEV